MIFIDVKKIFRESFGKVVDESDFYNDNDDDFIIDKE